MYIGRNIKSANAVPGVRRILVSPTGRVMVTADTMVSLLPTEIPYLYSYMRYHISTSRYSLLLFATPRYSPQLVLAPLVCSLYSPQLPSVRFGHSLVYSPLLTSAPRCSPLRPGGGRGGGELPGCGP